MITKLLTGILLVFVLLFVAAVGALYYYQRDLIYPIPPADNSVPEGFEAISYQKADGLELSAGFRPPLDGMPTLLFFHGNGVSWQTTYHTTQFLAARGYGVLAAEYRGYSGNPGEPHEEGLYADGAAAFLWLEEQGHEHDDIVLVGNSLGSGVAVELAQEREVLALVLVAPFKSMTATASNRFPFAPVEMLLQDRFENIAKIGDVVSPLLIVHGERDGLIPVDHARELAAAHANAQFVALEGFGHNMSGDAAAQIPQLEFLEALRD